MLTRKHLASILPTASHIRSQKKASIATARPPASRWAGSLGQWAVAADALEQRVLLSAVVQSATGANVAAVTPARDAFRVTLGGGAVAGANGSFGGVRREINWDGVPAAASAPNALPADFFNTTSPRGVVFATAGASFQVSGAAADAGAGQPAVARFGNINPTYSTAFSTFSPERLFTAVGSNVTDVNFFLPGTTTPATTNGFGVVFTDVDTANSTSIEYFDQNNVSLGTFFATATPGNGSLSFLGVSFDAGERVSRVRITSGAAALGADDVTQNAANADVVAMDDFLYGDPAAFIVTNTTDTGVGSLRQAIANANTVPAKQTISFNIAPGGVQTIQPAGLPDLTITGPVNLDGTTQPGFSGTPIIELDGSAASNSLLILAANDSVIRGFVLNRGDVNDVIRISGSGNVIAGNYIGTNVAGTATLPNDSTGILIEPNASNNTIGGATAADRNVISGNGGNAAIEVGIGGGGTGTNNIIIGNYIGTDVTGTIPLGNSGGGVILNGVFGNRVGGSLPGEGNIIAANGGIGMDIVNGNAADNHDNIVQGNFIGTDVSGTLDLGNGLSGVRSIRSRNIIGGSVASAGNVIAFNNGAGVVIGGGPVGLNPIRNNAIYSNTGLEIDLAPSLTPDGLTANDPGDADTGGNGFQNFPVLGSVISTPSGGTTVQGLLSSTANTNFLIDLYLSTGVESNGSGQARSLLGTVLVKTDASGDASFNATFPAVLSAGHHVVATATTTAFAPFGDTSEFGPPVDVTVPPPPPPPATPPTIKITDVSLKEGDSGTKDFTFHVSLSNSSTSTVTVNFNTQNGTATTLSGDYVGKSGMLTFTPGQNSKTVTVKVNGDTNIEADETFFLKLSAPTNATIADMSGTGTILNNDPAPPKISVSGSSATEGNSSLKGFTFKITLDRASSKTVSVKYATSNGTAIAGSDYNSANATVTFAAGETVKTITVFVKGDSMNESDENFFVKLSSAINATIAVGTGKGTIRNDD